MTSTPAWPPRILPRLYVKPPMLPGVAGQANYLGNVLRLKESDEVLLFDGVSGEWQAGCLDAV